ncbi:aminodeoxychorismate synthase component I [Salinisphaera japonica]|uniref:Anthranilate synthase n=1 Tax=Salinisphaera japonica YTM-1 TaxID=1209778 RepID=A0A423Q297_9GAMM|nr:aminodeoxychorismate synthase component I [Salinisphaera japonica]ROO32683.1 hypothetical protein SAJA_00040 [Salinisphaera japonica YTM-1]
MTHPQDCRIRRQDHVLTWLTLDASRCISLDRLAENDPAVFPFLMESSAGAAAQSRYDILLADPDPASSIEIEDLADAPAFFDWLDAQAAAYTETPVPELAFIGGWFIYLGYEMATGVEPRLRLPVDADDPLPHALAVRCTAGLIHDRAAGQIHIVVEGDARARGEALAGQVTDDSRPGPENKPPAIDWQEDPAEQYLAAVNRARDYIAAGDVFQTNLARAWHGRLLAETSPATIYRALRAANPAPFSGLMQWRGAALISSSPERLLQISDGRASVRPIAGTRRRYDTSDPTHDSRSSDELIAHPKERAEHVMLIDLVRNDLGRVCQPGTVAVDELMTVESYAHVHHIVSNVFGRLQPDIGPGAALRAVFPGGTITGCPKVRCMEIIGELEATGRGAYTGSFGYLSRCGRLDTNIVIRSLTQSGQALVLRTGAGIVADSIPEAELEETRHKATGVLRAFVDRNGTSYA